jgi:uncharacterized protein YegL
MTNMYEGIKPVQKRMTVFYVLDTSGSMEGQKMGTVNNTIREILPEMEESVPGVEMRVAFLAYSTGSRWLYPQPLAPSAVQWNNIQAGGSTDFGAAIRELNSKLSRYQFLQVPSVSLAPVLILLSDGQATDEYGEEMEKIRKNSWFHRGIKAALAIGDDADIPKLVEFTGDIESVIQTEPTPEKIKQWLKEIAITSTIIGSRSQPDAGGQIVPRQKLLGAELQKVRAEMENDLPDKFD